MVTLISLLLGSFPRFIIQLFDAEEHGNVSTLSIVLFVKTGSNRNTEIENNPPTANCSSLNCAVCLFQA